MTSTYLKIMDIEHLRNKKLNGSITVEAAFSFTLTVFILFLMIGPLLIIKTSSDILIELNKVSKIRCNYEAIKDNIGELVVNSGLNKYIDSDTIDKNANLIERIASYTMLASNIYVSYDDDKSEYRNIDLVYDLNDKVYDEKTGIVQYDYNVSFNLPYNILHVNNVNKRLLISRRAFIGSVGDRFSNKFDTNDCVFVANNYVNSSVYHININCSYLIKSVESFSYADVKYERNDNNLKYTKCSYCFKNKKINSDTSCYITKTGDRFHYKSNCPLMTAYVTKIPKEYIDTYNLRPCFRCAKEGE